MTLDEQIKCVKREIDYRKRLYPVWVQNGKMTQNDANEVLLRSQNMKQPDRNNFVAQYLLKWGVK